MPAPARSSGDLLADRRYAWAEAALAEGDAQAAADLAGQVLERVPGYGPAWLLIGRARAADPALRAGAAEAFRAALALDPEDALGARLHLAELGETAEDAISPAYIRALFDGYAGRFERHLVEGLGYCGPALIRTALERLRGPDLFFSRVLDLGCGTGLMARALEGIAGSLAGIDLSPRMLAEARRTGLYARLHEGDLRDFLGAEPARERRPRGGGRRVHLPARDRPGPHEAAARVLAAGGLFAFTVQGHPGERGAVLGADGRYAHGVATLREAAGTAGLAVALLEPAEIRRQNGAGCRDGSRCWRAEPEPRSGRAKSPARAWASRCPDAALPQSIFRRGGYRLVVENAAKSRILERFAMATPSRGALAPWRNESRPHLPRAGISAHPGRDRTMREGPRMLTLRQIEVARAVMVTGTIAGAARLLNVSAPGISRLMKYTEASLGFRLFDRRGGRLVPSEQARHVFAQINAVFDKIEDLRFVLERTQGGAGQELSIGSVPSISHVMVPRAIERVRAAYPHLVIDINILKLEEAIDYLLLGKGEVVAMSYRLDHPALTFEPLARGGLFCIVPLDHPLAAAPRSRPRRSCAIP